MAAHVRRRDGNLYCFRRGRQRVIASLNPFSPPLTPSFIAAFAALGVSFSGACLGKDGFLGYDGDDNILAFSPVNPLSENDGKTTGNRLRLTRFLPVNLSFVAAFAALRVSFPGACPGKDGFFIFTKRQRVIASLNPFSLRAALSFLRYVFAERKRIYYKKERGATLAKVKYY